MVDLNIRVRELSQISGRELAIEWTDGRRDIFDVVALRRACPCANCIDEWTGEKRLKPESIPDTLRPIKIESVGSYAMQIWFADGHNTGIYTFSLLRNLARKMAES
jgi:DUF971 family protein